MQILPPEGLGVGELDVAVGDGVGVGQGFVPVAILLLLVTLYWEQLTPAHSPLHVRLYIFVSVLSYLTPLHFSEGKGTSFEPRYVSVHPEAQSAWHEGGGGGTTGGGEATGGGGAAGGTPQVDAALSPAPSRASR